MPPQSTILEFCVEKVETSPAPGISWKNFSMVIRSIPNTVKGGVVTIRWLQARMVKNSSTVNRCLKEVGDRF